MKQKLKISIGSSLQKAATCLTVAATIATLGFTFSCSSDNDYEEPWLNKEHRTRAAMMDDAKEPIYVRVLVAGQFDYTHQDTPFDIALHFSWPDGNEAVRFPKPSVSIIDNETHNDSVSVTAVRCNWGSIGGESINYTIDYTVNGHDDTQTWNIDNPEYKTKLIESTRTL